MQGVGFRYSSYTEANLIGLTGWVRNLSEGTVEMEVQGTKEKIQQLIENISSQRFISIEYKEEEQIEEIEEEGFEIR